MGNTVASTERAVQQAEIQGKALALRRQGLTYEQVGKELSIPKKRAWRLIQAAIRDITYENAEQVRHIEISRLDAMLRGIWERAIKGDVKAILAALKISEHRCRLTGAFPKDMVPTGGVNVNITAEQIIAQIQTLPAAELQRAAAGAFPAATMQLIPQTIDIEDESDEAVDLLPDEPDEEDIAP